MPQSTAQSTGPSTDAPQGPKALVVPPHHDAEVIHLPVNPAAMLTALNDILGGYLEAVRPARVDWVCYCNEDGKRLGQPPNLPGDHLLRALGWKFRPGDFLVGPAVFLGAQAGNPDETDVPETVLTLARQMGLIK